MVGLGGVARSQTTQCLVLGVAMQLKKMGDFCKRQIAETTEPQGFDFRASLAAARLARAAADAAKPQMPPAGQLDPLGGSGKGGGAVDPDDEDDFDAQFV